MTKDKSKTHLIMTSPNTGWLRKGTGEKEVEKVEDDRWRKDLEK